MAIDRTAFNALVDDDGTGLTGTIWNKAQIQAVLLDPIDAMGATILFNADVGALNDWNLGIRGDSLVIWIGNSPTNVSGIAGGTAGRRLTIVNQSSGGGILFFYPGNTGSAPVNQVGNYVASGPTPIAQNGVARYIHSGSNWVLVGHEQSAWITAPFLASDYGASGGMSWTVSGANVGADRYLLRGRTLHYVWNISGTTLAGTAGQTITRRMYGYTTVGSSNIMGGTMVGANAGAPITPVPLGSGAAVMLYRDGAAASYTLGSLAVYGMGAIEVT